ncbi:hypothetical protein ASD15_12710 [Massilia sp. Root351]|jgi:hypothetical protein|uniref:hypothetical protein n=1 Tax=Massilia sp. Root351 TaxID=1736522 RepID=UPI00070E8948|nr:hypothetical protein [Massilia sp. Root351]KQV80777.1 hypothetical protein ASD15_12710 [Massilia sp. Root351]
MGTLRKGAAPGGAQPAGWQVLLVVLGTALLLLVPLVAMQFTDEVVWTGSDFAIAGVLLAGTGLSYVAAARLLRTRQRRLALGLGLALLLALVWVELAVGLIGTPFAGS